MIPLSVQHVVNLDALLANGTVPSIAFPESVGETTLCGGVWRLYSNVWPRGGITAWNKGSEWKNQWQSFLPSDVFAFGEDVFGNQLFFVNGFENALLWNHENSDCFDLLLKPCELLMTVLKNGADWIDFYADGSLSVAKEYGSVPKEMHLHWTTPLVLGGEVTRENLSLAQRESHLVGHAKLWSQLAVLPPGTEIKPRL